MMFFPCGDCGVSAGFWQNWGAERGFLMVNLWWNAGELWLFDGH
jgi:hypothetical protein